MFTRDGNHNGRTCWNRSLPYRPARLLSADYGKDQELHQVALSMTFRYEYRNMLEKSFRAVAQLYNQVKMTFLRINTDLKHANTDSRTAVLLGGTGRNHPTSAGYKLVNESKADNKTRRRRL